MPGRELLDNLMQASRSALPSTWKSAFWLLKLMIPISLAVALLQHWGILAWIAGYLNPLFSMMGLPGESAVLFISGAAAGTYAGVAAMMSVHLTLRQATIVGIILLSVVSGIMFMISLVGIIASESATTQVEDNSVFVITENS